MNAEEAAATGAHRDEIDPSDLALDVAASARHRAATYDDMQVPGGGTDPLWYVAAKHLCPHMSRSDRLRWIEGFVSALEVLRGINAPLPGVSDVLRDSIRMQPNPGEVLDADLML